MPRVVPIEEPGIRLPSTLLILNLYITSYNKLQATQRRCFYFETRINSTPSWFVLRCWCEEVSQSQHRGNCAVKITDTQKKQASNNQTTLA